MRRLGAAIATAAMLALPCAAAAPASGHSYRVVWMVVPEEVPAVAWITPHTSIASARLAPLRLYVLNDAVKGPEGTAILPAGTELIAPVSDLKLGCTMKPAGLYMLSPRFFCMIDSDRDGRFDQMFKANTPLKVLFTGTGQVPSRLTAIGPSAYEERDPLSAAFRPRIYVQYGWFASFVGELVFQTCLNENDDGSHCLQPDFSVKSKQLPGEFEALGARFRVEAKEENRVQVRMLSPFQRKPFILYYQ